ncbi:hypothetical protein OJAV_G00224390 [Oryzias javanicus]|uniref:RING-type domain-containing protein n=1 Tax=Oryzias javanicus TaxID=123683 RepID=A0A437C1Y2_ORYJA|nr:hypothetical protein OJAV_G00224390 [Oryzias javanicus]
MPLSGNAVSALQSCLGIVELLRFQFHSSVFNVLELSFQDKRKNRLKRNLSSFAFVNSSTEMASTIKLISKDQFLCSICLEVFKDPVSTRCGHNYCKSCITEYWDNSCQIQCPICRTKFHRKPKLFVNTEFRDMVENFRHMKVKTEGLVYSMTGMSEITKPKLYPIFGVFDDGSNPSLTITPVKPTVEDVSFAD